MKKHLITSLFVLATCSTATHAQSGSSLKLFGVMDAGIRNVKNGSLGFVKSEVSGSNMSSRWGVTGEEKISNDVAAQFWLESAVAADNGSTGASVPPAFFDRRSTLSLTSAQYGELRMGRDYVPTFLAMSASDPFTAVGLGSTNNFVSQSATRAMNQAFGASSNANTTGRFNNSIQYFTPNAFGNFYAHLTTSLGENAANSGGGNSKTNGYRIGYKDGKIDTSYASLKTKNTLVVGQSFSDDVISGSYNFGIVKLSATQRNFKFMTDKQSTTWLAASAPVGSGTLKLSVSKANQTGATSTLSANDASMFALGYVYDLSKSTAIYTHTARVMNKGSSFFALSGGPSVAATTFGGQASSGYEFGVRTRF